MLFIDWRHNKLRVGSYIGQCRPSSLMFKKWKINGMASFPLYYICGVRLGTISLPSIYGWIKNCIWPYRLVGKNRALSTPMPIPKISTSPNLSTSTSPMTSLCCLSINTRFSRLDFKGFVFIWTLRISGGQRSAVTRPRFSRRRCYFQCQITHNGHFFSIMSFIPKKLKKIWLNAKNHKLFENIF